MFEFNEFVLLGMISYGDIFMIIIVYGFLGLIDWIVKCCFDLVLVSVVLVLFLLFFIVVGIFVKLDLCGLIFFI